MDPEVRKELDKIWKEIEELKKGYIKDKNKKKIEGVSFKGLSGGINFLINNSFLDKLRSVDEIWNELKREGYHYPKTSVSKILNVDFVNKKKILNRLKENKVWKYALRK